jgi:sarcosine oxidase
MPENMVYYDVAIIGLGAMGSAALHRLALRNVRAIGIDARTPGHTEGSSHGETRVIRLGYFEHPSYVPLVREAYTLWRALERETGVNLLTVTGIVEIGAPESALIRGTLESSRLHNLPHDILNAEDLMKRFPAFRVSADHIGVYQPDAGFLAAEQAIAAQIAAARAVGAAIKTQSKVSRIEQSPRGVRIVMADGIIEAGKVIVAAGPWLKQLLPDLPAPIHVTRQVLGWFRPRDAAPFTPDQFPVFLFESRHGVHYGFPPNADGNLKISKHHHFSEATDPETCDRTVSARDEKGIRDFIADHLPAANGPMVDATTCLYTMTPDEDFIIDRLPGNPNVLIASPCSGHGFKFAPVIGDILADLATLGATQRDISRFSLSRFR